MEKVIQQISHSLKNHSSQDTGKWIIAYSGGVDSRVMLEVLATIKPENKELIAVHVNHGLYEKAADWEDKALEVAKKHNVTMHIERLNMQHSSAIEESARDLRYAAINKYVEAGDLIFTGHHKNDNTETVLFRLFRGTGLTGLGGIPETRSFGKGNLLRPMLNLSREDIEKFAENHGLKHVEDPSNKDSKYTRNFLRNEVIPLLETRWNRIVDNVTSLAKKAKEAENLLEEIAIEDIYDLNDLHEDYKTAPCLNIEKLVLLSPSRLKNALYYFINLHVGDVKSSRYFDNLMKVILSENKNNSKLRMVDFGEAAVYCNGKKMWVLHYENYIHDELMQENVNLRKLKNFIQTHLPDTDIHTQLKNGKSIFEHRMNYLFQRELKIAQDKNGGMTIAPKDQVLNTMYIYRDIKGLLEIIPGIPDFKSFLKDKNTNSYLLHGALLATTKYLEMKVRENTYDFNKDEEFKTLFKSHVLIKVANDESLHIFKSLCNLLNKGFVSTFHFNEKELTIINENLTRVFSIEKDKYSFDSILLHHTLDFYSNLEKEHLGQRPYQVLGEIIAKAIVHNNILVNDNRWSGEEKHRKLSDFILSLTKSDKHLAYTDENLTLLHAMVDHKPELKDALAAMEKRLLNTELSADSSISMAKINNRI